MDVQRTNQTHTTENTINKTNPKSKLRIIMPKQKQPYARNPGHDTTKTTQYKTKQVKQTKQQHAYKTNTTKSHKQTWQHKQHINTTTHNITTMSNIIMYF